ncbi:MAG: shikimate dehydrogenase [Betaproteobacteria bacterium]|nr:shikimate dehydrogenase [Betaproteobacteria bacterium]
MARPCNTRRRPTKSASCARHATRLLLSHRADRFRHPGFPFTRTARARRRRIPDAPRNRVVQLGAGGAGAAVAHAALTLGTQRLHLFDVTEDRAARLADDLSRRFGAGRALAGGDLAAAMSEADGLIHATPTGMANHPGLPLPVELLGPDLWVAEIVYFPLETALLKEAARIGCRTLHGGGMAVFQAVEAFRLFTGIVPDEKRMLDHFQRMIGT